ncbi:hypothetical protein EUTSA_v10011599mg [Eutrema salsugineum]|uniref:Electron transfer flavoprotein subunit alpha, mitochondrial n=1 Tax=Eutrema salsugineum TaxID=72664 RepID=V4JY03_EUTSA|nr:hypothetical protein EUTSA_v10011599mg [Eutrema salsugineum]
MTRAVLLRALTKNKFVASNIPRSLSVTNLSRCISTLILAEHESGSIKAQTVSTVVAAGSLGESSTISLLLAGSGSSLHEAAAQAASCHPSVSEVLVADSDKFEYPLAEPWAKLVDFVRQRGEYSHILASSSSFGKNILPRVAALLDVSPITDVVKILGSNEFIRPIYAGNALCTVRYTGSGPCMLTIRSTSFPVTPISADSQSKKATISQIDLSKFKEDSVSRSRYVGQSTQDTERPDLGSARVVITGGRALKSVENFKMIEKLAEKLGGAVGATRAAVDAGYVPNDLQAIFFGSSLDYIPSILMAFKLQEEFVCLRVCVSGGTNGKNSSTRAIHGVWCFRSHSTFSWN